MPSPPQKTRDEPHQKFSSSAPPMIGPIAIAVPVAAPHRPMACARSRRSSKTFEISESVVGKITAAPIPATIRQKINMPAELLQAPAIDAMT
jgi:hypothetical protein